jgi:hypothetical protein
MGVKTNLRGEIIGCEGCRFETQHVAAVYFDLRWWLVWGWIHALLVQDEAARLSQVIRDPALDLFSQRSENLGCFLECAEVVIEVQFEAATRASEAPSVRVVPKISGILMYYRIYRQRYTCDLQNSHFGQLSSPPMRDCNVYV